MSLLSTNLQAQDCTPGCSKIANGDFESPKVASMTANGHSSYGGNNFPSANSAFVDGEVSCWQAHQHTPHIWPNDTASSLNHFAAFFTSWYIDSFSGVAEASEASIIIQDFCLDSGLHYKIRYDYYGYKLLLPWTGWITLSFTDNFNFDVYNPNSGDVIYQEYVTTNDSFNTSAIPPPYLNMNWHPMESDSFEFSGQDYLVIAPKFDINNPSINYNEQYAGVIFIDNIEFIPYIEFDSEVLCSPDTSFQIFPELLPANTQLEYYPVSSNISNLTNSGDSCIIQVSGMVPNIPSEVIIAYAIMDTACNGEPCISYDTLVTELYLYEPPQILNVEVGKCPCNGFPYFVSIPSDSLINGTAPFSYQWSTDPVTVSDTLFNPPHGAYTVTVTDANGCEDVFDFNILCLNLEYRDIYDATCNTVCNGWIESLGVSINPCGGTITFPVSFEWSNGQVYLPGTNVTNLCPGEYYVTITDAVGLMGIDTVIIEPSYNPTLSTSINHNTCLGLCDGYVEATLNNSSAYPIIDFTLFNTSFYQNISSSIPLGEFDNLCEGTYMLLATDSNGCADSVSVEIQTLEFYNEHNLIVNSCSSGDTMQIELSTTGYYPPFSYQWSHGPTTQNVQITTPGTYYVTTTNNNNCQMVDTFNIGFEDLEVLLFPTPPTCATINNGEIEIIINGGMPPYIFEWSTGSTNQNLTGLNIGQYQVTVTDALGCTKTETVSFTDFLYLSSNLHVTPPTCVDANNNSTLGSIDLTPQNGEAPYYFLWSNSATTEDLDNLLPGTYTVTIMDSYGCEVFNSASVPDYTLIIDLHDIGQGCDGDSTVLALLENGTIDAAVYGGTPPYTYSWNVSGSDAHLSGLLDSTVYVLTVTDANNCFGIDSIEVMSQQVIDLRNGWSYWSTYINLEDVDVSDYFNANGLSADIIIMKNHNGDVYWPIYGINFITEFNKEYGYQILMPNTGNFSFTARGSLICPEDCPIFVDNGWSFIPYVRKTPNAIFDELGSYNSYIDAVKNSDGNLYWPAFGVNTIDSLYPGEGYTIKPITPFSFTYTPNDNTIGTKTIQNAIYPTFDNSDIRTDAFMIVGIPTTAWETEPNHGSLILAIGEKNQVVGRAYYYSEFLGIVLYGDDSSTLLETEGLSEGESFTLEIVNQSTKTKTKAQIDLKSWQRGDGYFQKEKISVVAPKSDILIENVSPISTFQILPNPNSGDFKVVVEAQQDILVNLSIRNMQGQLIYAKPSISFNSGSNTIEVSNLPVRNGSYMVQIQAKGLNMSKTMIISKN